MDKYINDLLEDPEFLSLLSVGFNEPTDGINQSTQLYSQSELNQALKLSEAN